MVNYYNAFGEPTGRTKSAFVKESDYADLEAKLAEKVKVKPLEWSPVEGWNECSRERAPAFGGEYQIVMLDPGEGELPSLYFEIGLGAFMFRFEQDQDPMGLPGETSPKKFLSVKAAKAAAQADYERRILSALEATAPAPKVTEAALPQDVIDLVIAAREFWDANDDLSPESRALDKALEEFSSRVPYAEEPDTLTTAQESGQ